MSIDYGTKFIGIAISDPAESIATPVKVLPATKNHLQNAQAVLKLASDYKPDGFVIGLALNMDGSHGPQANYTLKFAATLQQFTPCPVETWDERLSTFAAEELLAAQPGEPRPNNRRSDAVAAQLVLEAFMAARRNPGSPPQPT